MHVCCFCTAALFDTNGAKLGVNVQFRPMSETEEEGDDDWRADCLGGWTQAGAEMSLLAVIHMSPYHERACCLSCYMDEEGGGGAPS